MRVIVASDVGSVTITETAQSSGVLGSSDTSSVSVSDNASPVVFLSTTDTLNVSVSDAGGAEVLFFKSASDSASVAVTDSSITSVVVNTSETAQVAVSEASSSFKTLSVSDSTTLGMSDSSATVVVVSSADTAAVGVIDTALPLGEQDSLLELSASDTVSVRISEFRKRFDPDATVLVSSVETNSVTAAHVEVNNFASDVGDGTIELDNSTSTKERVEGTVSETKQSIE
jgi:hypothetical protein